MEITFNFRFFIVDVAEMLLDVSISSKIKIKQHLILFRLYPPELSYNILGTVVVLMHDGDFIYKASPVTAYCELPWLSMTTSVIKRARNEDEVVLRTRC
jgi:hypothetical protein